MSGDTWKVGWPPQDADWDDYEVYPTCIGIIWHRLKPKGTPCQP